MISKETAQEDLTPFMAPIRECLEFGYAKWREFGQVAPALQGPLDKRARASFIFCHIIVAVRDRFGEMRDVRIRETRGFPELLIKGRFVIRFKKLDQKGRARNIPTRQTILWFEQQAELPEMPPKALKLVAGYVLSLLETEIERYLVICPISTSEVEWMIDLKEPEAPPTVVEIPRKPKQPRQPGVRSKRKIKKDSTKKDSEG